MDTSPSASGPLAGIKVVELGQLIAGPFAAKTLADFGANVIKIEPPGVGDPLRKWRLLKDGTSVWWQVQSRNKRSVALNLRDPQAQDIVRQLATDADVLIENFRPGAMEGWGLGPEALQVLNPRLIVLRISGYGQTGPWSDKPGFGVVAEAMGGLRHLTAEPGRVPVRVGDDASFLGLSVCAMVAAPYFVGEQPRGTVAIVGPVRMEYARVIPLVTYTARAISGIFRGAIAAA